MGEGIMKQINESEQLSYRMVTEDELKSIIEECFNSAFKKPAKFTIYGDEETFKELGFKPEDYGKK